MLGLEVGVAAARVWPLVLAMTFAAMHYFGIGLHKISLGALVLALFSGGFATFALLYCVQH